MDSIDRRTFFSSAASLSAAALVSGGIRQNPAAGAALDGPEVPWLAEVQEPPALETDHRDSILEGPGNVPIESIEGWRDRREVIKSRWLDYLGPLEENPGEPDLEILEEDQPAGVTRRLVEYEGEPGLRVRGYLLEPRVVEDRRPGVVVLHSTVDHTIRQPAGVEGTPAKAFGLHLAQMGCVTFCPECFLWHDKGDRDYYEQTQRFFDRHPGSKGMAKMLFDAQRAVDVLESRPTVDNSRIGAIGHSLGAKEVVYLAAFDDRITASVSSEGGISTQFSNWEAPWYLGEAIDEFGHDHDELLALAAPRPFLLVGGDSADGAGSWPFVEAAMPVYELYRGRPSLGLLNHDQGHSVPRVAELRALQWLLTYL